MIQKRVCKSWRFIFKKDLDNFFCRWSGRRKTLIDFSRLDKTEVGIYFFLKQIQVIIQRGIPLKMIRNPQIYFMRSFYRYTNAVDRIEVFY